MTLDIGKLAAIGSVGSVTRELAHIEEDRASWRNALAQTDSISKQWRELSKVGSVYAQLVKDLQSPAMTLASQYKALLGEDTAVMQTIRQWQAAQQEQQASIRKMLEPLADIRKSLIAAESTHRVAKEFAGLGAITEQFRSLLDQTSVLGSVAKTGVLQLEASRHTREIFERAAIGSSLQSYLKEFEQVNKQWKVPSEVLGLVGSLKELQDQFGKVALPAIDWSSAGALAQLLGKEGLEGQLAHLGIDPDGTLHEAGELPEKGLLSRKQSDALAILSLLLTFLIFIYQEASSQQDKRKAEEFQAQTTQILEIQANQIRSLTVLLERALVAAAQTQDERFVVRERTATVRSKPEHGAMVEGKLLPNEVVKALDKKGKWIEVEYYHWLHEEYRTGWVLKKYLERVPASYSNSN
ncbi:SH3 domain-containing protein [Bordetella trematum]|uniref:SH3 domain-containing protein n=1 Tax=Bordetella trematum TaxID=123899 RepID=UPI003AF34B3F